MTRELHAGGPVDRFVNRRWPDSDPDVLLYAVGLRYLHARPLAGDGGGSGGYFGFGPGLGAWPSWGEALPAGSRRADGSRGPQAKGPGFLARTLNRLVGSGKPQGRLSAT